MYLFENWKETYLSYRGKINYASNREAIRLIVKIKVNKLVYIYYLPRISYSLKTEQRRSSHYGIPNNIGWNGFYANSGSYVRKGTERD